jgi:transposase
MALTIVETPAITGGVDTHADVHVAAALDPIGGLLGIQEFPVTPAGYAHLLDWLGGFGTVCLVGIEGTGSYGAGLARHVSAAGVRVVEVDRSDRQDRRRQGKSDPLDAVSAARAAQSGRARGAPKGRDGTVEAIRVLMVAKRSARSERIQTINQARALVLTGPDDLRVRFAGHAVTALVAELASLRPRPGSTVGYATRIALRELGRRAQFLDAQLDRLDELIVPLVTAHAPGLLALYGIGAHTAAAAHRGRRPPRAAAQRGCLGAPVRRRPDPGIIRQDRPPPAQPWRRPPGQPCPMADRVHPDGLRPGHPRLRRPPHQGRPVEERDHPLPQAIRSPRGLPTPPHRGELTPSRGRPGPLIGCRTRWPANDPPAAPGASPTCWA